MAFIDVDSTHKRVSGRTKQGAEYCRFKGIRTLHPLPSTIHNLLRATGALDSAFHARSTTAPLRAHLTHVPARIARSAQRITLHPPGVLPGHPGRGRPALGEPGVIRHPHPRPHHRHRTAGHPVQTVSTDQVDEGMNCCNC
ncbi:hypothetical protein [Streptomyces sp. NBC_00893]|uniref:hypothetical protein n=1 Tax=Streptomyces sp. NBC_00893 TaxID=2975862 RepID=UPI0022568911|nr:hypothetical protein [Streptomyces sp. NBC_00893]MCX4851254.1 hypothetical protein [Streptomyces sp. NBC_00893]